MAKKQIEIGLVYSAKIQGSRLPMEVLSRIPGGRWKVRNILDAEAKPVTVKEDVLKGDGEPLEQAMARLTGSKAEAETGKHPVEPETADTPAGQTVKRASGLDAAAAVLADAGTPMKVSEMVNRMLGRGLWTTNGKTPAATIYAAIIREIATKGTASRFRKAGRGFFGLAN